MKADGRGIQSFTSGWSTWRWLSGVGSKEKAWFLGVIRGRGGYEAWMSHLTQGLQDSDFLLKFEAQTDPWERSKMVGKKISELRESFMKMPRQERAELASQAEVELKVGLDLMGKDKKTIEQLIALVDPPANH